MKSSPQQIGIAIVEQTGCFLIGERRSDQVLAGCAEFPGGKCEPGESPRDCAVRECLEETGLSVEAEQLLDRTTFSYPHGDVELHFWLCRPADSACVLANHQGYRWIPRSELSAQRFPTANQTVVSRLLSGAFGVDTQAET